MGGSRKASNWFISVNYGMSGECERRNCEVNRKAESQYQVSKVVLWVIDAESGKWMYQLEFYIKRECLPEI